VKVNKKSLKQYGDETSAADIAALHARLNFLNPGVDLSSMRGPSNDRLTSFTKTQEDGFTNTAKINQGITKNQKVQENIGTSASNAWDYAKDNPLDAVQIGLGSAAIAADAIPFVGTGVSAVADGANAAISAGRSGYYGLKGDSLNSAKYGALAALDLAAVVPGAGNIASASKIATLANTGRKVAHNVGHTGAQVATVGKTADAVASMQMGGPVDNQEVDPAIQQISQFISESLDDGQDPRDVVLGLIEQEVDQQAIAYGFMNVGYQEEDVITLFEQVQERAQPAPASTPEEQNRNPQELARNEAMMEQGGEGEQMMAQSGIEIKPENKGKFTRWAEARGMTVPEAANKVMSNTENYPPSVVKMANFAKNAAGWKKQEGGESSNYTEGVRQREGSYNPPNRKYTLDPRFRKEGGEFKPHFMYKGERKIRAKDMATHLRLKEAGYTHEAQRGVEMPIDRDTFSPGSQYVNPLALESGNDWSPIELANILATGGKKMFSGKDEDGDGTKDGSFRNWKRKGAEEELTKGDYYDYKVNMDEMDSNSYAGDRLDLFNASKGEGSLRTTEQYNQDVRENSSANFNPETGKYDAFITSRGPESFEYTNRRGETESLLDGNKSIENARAGENLNYFTDLDDDTKNLILGTQDDPEGTTLGINELGQASSYAPGADNPYQYNTMMGYNRDGVDTRVGPQNSMIPTGDNGQPSAGMYDQELNLQDIAMPADNPSPFDFNFTDVTTEPSVNNPNTVRQVTRPEDQFNFNSLYRDRSNPPYVNSGENTNEFQMGSEVKSALKAGGLTFGTSLLTRLGSSLMQNRGRDKDAFAQWKAGQDRAHQALLGMDYDEYCLTGDCPQNPFQGDPPNFKDWRNHDYFGEDETNARPVYRFLNDVKDNALEGEVGPAIKKATIDGIIGGGLNYVGNKLLDNTRFGRNLKRNFNVKFNLQRKNGGDLPIAQGGTGDFDYFFSNPYDDAVGNNQQDNEVINQATGLAWEQTGLTNDPITYNPGQIPTSNQAGPGSGMGGMFLNDQALQEELAPFQQREQEFISPLETPDIQQIAYDQPVPELGTDFNSIMSYDDPTVERTNKFEGGFNRVMDSKEVEAYADASDFAVNAASNINDFFRGRAVRDAKQDNKELGYADNAYGTTEDRFDKRGGFTLNDGDFQPGGRQVVQTGTAKKGGEITNVNSTLLAKLIAAGADIEIL
jgi:hypothetical protein